MSLQKVGAGLLGLAYILFIIGETGYSYGTLLLAGLLDLYLVWRDQQTISQWVQDLTDNKVIDYLVLTVLGVSAIIVFTVRTNLYDGLTAALPVIMTGLALHLFANKD